MIVQTNLQAALLRLALDLGLRGSERNADTQRPRPQSSDFADLLNMQYAQAAGVVPRPNLKVRANTKPPAKRERSSDNPDRQDRQDRGQQGTEQRTRQHSPSAWA